VESNSVSKANDCGKLLYEGKGKKVFQSQQIDEVILFFKDDLTAFNALKKGQFEKKGQMNCQISTLIFKLLKSKNIKTHWIETFAEDQMRVQKTQIIPLEVVIRNFAAGSFAQKFKIQDGASMKYPLVEYYYKNDELKDPFVSEGQVVYFEWCTESELEQIKAEALKINDALLKIFALRNLQLIDFKIEFGKNKSGEIILSDEISPDCMRLWDQQTKERLDKDRFRLDLGDVGQGYSRILNELNSLNIK
jgi:phosphoribosylaminoimidazole-succinocarboxamide synthase